MKKKFIGLFILLAAFAVSLSAHPLGNFSVNQFSRVEVESSQIKVRSILDLAEIPSFQLKGEIDTDKDGVYSQSELDVYVSKITPEHLANLNLAVDGKTVDLRESTKKIGLHPGEGGMPLIRVEWDFVGDFQTENSGSHQVRI